MKISKRTREQAALICAVAASQGAWDWFIDGLPIGRTHKDARYLAERAFEVANVGERDWHDIYAEAEALLRTGWTPGWTP